MLIVDDMLDAVDEVLNVEVWLAKDNYKEINHEKGT
jgi:hypothetical protein